jgi:hypothetical protein
MVDHLVPFGVIRTGCSAAMFRMSDVGDSRISTVHAATERAGYDGAHAEHPLLTAPDLFVALNLRFELRGSVDRGENNGSAALGSEPEVKSRRRAVNFRFEAKTQASREMPVIAGS